MYQTPLQQYVYVMLYKIMNAKSCITPTQCMADEITQSCGILLHGNREGSLHQSKSAGRRIVGVSCRNLSEGTPQPWPGEPWEPTKEKKIYLFVLFPLGMQRVTSTMLLWSYLYTLHLRSVPHQSLR